ncbi:hypothetical protein [Demequina sp.]|uniref:hypothetical protein n=1 Tax=Demequina sp. TaxID=2050685 RepID=UPI0025BDC6C9|nr:hypothetical protein [Demequina sp.]
MPEPAKTAAAPSKPKPGSDLPFEAQLWKAADTLCNNMDPAEYKHVVQGLPFHEHVSGSFGAPHTTPCCTG